MLPGQADTSGDPYCPSPFDAFIRQLSPSGRPLRGAFLEYPWALSLAGDAGGAEALPFQESAPVVGFDDDLSVPVPVPLGELPEGEGRRRAPRPALPRRLPARVSADHEGPAGGCSLRPSVQAFPRFHRGS